MNCSTWNITEHAISSVPRGTSRDRDRGFDSPARDRATQGAHGGFDALSRSRNGIDLLTQD